MDFLMDSIGVFLLSDLSDFIVVSSINSCDYNRPSPRLIGYCFIYHQVALNRS